jgi:mannitol-1-/sugar-/sorbitol-6-/2-deoxyglucose-6-phosphatase
MDGVLIDSEPLWQRAEIEIFPEVGIDLTPDLCRRTMGLRIDEVVAHWHEIHPWSSPSKEKVARRIVGRVGELIASEGRLLPGVNQALDFLGGKGRLGLASSSYYELIDAVLDGFSLRGHFDVVYSAEDESYGKPHPGIYLTTADKLGGDPTRCLAIEDSPNGVLAAKAARMKCIAVPEDGAERDARLRLADLTIGSLLEIDEVLWERVLAV